MGLNANNAAGGGNNGMTAPALEAGAYEARVVQVIDLGVQPQPDYQGQKKEACQEVMVTYELIGEYMQDEDGNNLEDKPRWFSERLNFKNPGAEKAKSTKRAKAIDPENTKKFDFSKFVGMPCLVILVNNISKKNGKTYTNIADVTTIRAAVAKNLPDLVNPPKVLDLDDPDLEIFLSLPDWVRNLITKDNLEFEGSKLQGLLDGHTQQDSKDDEVEEVDEDEVAY